VKYSIEEDKELNYQLKKWKDKASKLIFKDYYDCIKLSELEYSVLKAITNAETHNDINPYMWNSGMCEKVLDITSEKIKEAKRRNNNA